jgi:phosphoglycolate phosphatase
MRAPRLRLAVFDCDGTLIDSQHSIVAAMSAAFVDEGLAAPTAEAIRRTVGLPLDAIAERLAPAASHALRLRLVAAYRARVHEIRARHDHDEPLYDGARGALDALEAAGWLLGIATGKGRRGLEAVLLRHDLRRRFVTLQSGDDAPGKPDPGMLLQAMAEAGTSRQDTVMIGDTTFDMLMARNAGVSAIAVTWGYHPASELAAAGAAALIESYDQLPGVLATR